MLCMEATAVMKMCTQLMDTAVDVGLEEETALR